MTHVRFEINFDKILEVALRGVRRASVFMGFGVNAAQDLQFTNYQLTHITKIQLVPDNVTPETLKHFKDEFKTWVEANGFRELVEAFSSFLDQLHQACIAIKGHSEKLALQDVYERQKSFEMQGFPNKLNVLQTAFTVGPKHVEYLKSLNKARNCLTHRRGIVGPEDMDSGNEFRVSWLGMDIYIETPSGEKHMLNDIQPGLYLPEGGAVMAKMVERQRNYERGAPVLLSTRELAEICWFFEREARAAIISGIELAKLSGIVVEHKITEE